MPPSDSSSSDNSGSSSSDSSSSGSSGSSSSGSSSASSGKEPFIQGENGKTGWDAIYDDILNTPDGGTVYIDMNGTYEIPKRILAAIKGRDIWLVLNMENAVWTVNGLSVTDPKTVSLRVSFDTVIIPGKIMKALNSNPKAIQFRLYHDGDLGFTAKISLNVGSKYNDLYAALYYYNTKTKELEFMDEDFVESGRAEYTLTHASSYAIAFGKETILEDVAAGAGTKTNEKEIDLNSRIKFSSCEFLPEKKKKLPTGKKKYRITKIR